MIYCPRVSKQHKIPLCVHKMDQKEELTEALNYIFITQTHDILITHALHFNVRIFEHNDGRSLSNAIYCFLERHQQQQRQCMLFASYIVIKDLRRHRHIMLMNRGVG